jgi:hypothetical protein
MAMTIGISTIAHAPDAATVMVAMPASGRALEARAGALSPSRPSRFDGQTVGAGVRARFSSAGRWRYAGDAGARRAWRHHLFGRGS